MPGFGADFGAESSVWQSALLNCDGAHVRPRKTPRTACSRMSFQVLYSHDRSNAYRVGGAGLFASCKTRDGGFHYDDHEKR